MIKARLQYLRIAIRRWDQLCQLTAQGLAAEGIDDTAKASKSSKAKRKKGPSGAVATTSPNAQCGFDVRLVYESNEWAAWVAGEEGRGLLESGDENAGMEVMEGVCLTPRKKCERHNGWQKVREADFEVEKAVLVSRCSCSLSYARTDN